MWPYTDDETRWLDAEAPQRLVPQDQISPALIAHYERRAHLIRAQALATAAARFFNRWTGRRFRH